MKNSSPKSKYALLLSVLALGGAVFAFVVLDKLILSQTLNAEDMARKVLEATKQKERENELKKMVQENSDARSMLSLLLVPKDDIVGFIEKIEGVGVLSGAEVTLSSINAEAELKANIEAKGSWANVMRAVGIIENMPFRIAISDLKLERTVDEKKNSVWKASFVIKAPLMQ
jgi:hypothetical protein